MDSGAHSERWLVNEGMLLTEQFPPKSKEEGNDERNGNLYREPSYFKDASRVLMP